MSASLSPPRGDDLTPSELEQWFEDEREAYTRILPPRGYPYHTVNQQYGFRHLPPGRTFRRTLAFGGATGAELTPLLPRLAAVTLHDAARRTHTPQSLSSIPCTLSNARPDGTLPFPDHHVDLITCLGVLHHLAPTSVYLVLQAPPTP